jgi:hypothetical protein
MNNIYFSLIIVAILQIATIATILICYKKIKNNNEANINIFKNLMLESQNVIISDVDSLKKLTTKGQADIINGIKALDIKNENILKELKEPLSLD